MNWSLLIPAAGALVLAAGPISAANAQPCTQARATTFVFGNGMFNSRIDALTSTALLRDAVLTRASSDEGAERTFELAYNENEPVLSQLYEIARQRLGADSASFWRMLSGLELAPDWFQDNLLRLASDLELESFVEDGDLALHVARYRALVAQGSKVVLVAHSQGNLYANAAYLTLFERGEPLEPPAFGIVGVATPAEHVAGSGPEMPYTTLEEDMVIAAVRLAFPATLPANSSTGGQAVDALGHGFETAYFAVPAAREQVLTHVVAVQQRLPQPQPRAATLAGPSDSSVGCLDAASALSARTQECTLETFRGTCVQNFFGACWNPTGACTLQLDLLGASSLRWANGARVEIITDLSSLEHPRARALVVGASGEECGFGHTFSTNDPSCIGGAYYTSDKGTLHYCVDGYGSLRGVCPDGSTFTRAADASCVFGASANACAL